MADNFSSPGSYQIEASGWGLDDNFFVEKTTLRWLPSGNKLLQLHRTLPEGAMIFVRLVDSESMKGSAPVAYRVDGIQAMNCEGTCEMQLQQLHPRSKAPYTRGSASNVTEDSFSAREPRESSIQLERKEILQ